MTGLPPHPARYVHDGPAAVVPGRVAAWLLRYTDLASRRIEHRGEDPEVDAVLVALSVAGQAWRSRGSVERTEIANPDEPTSACGPMSTTDVADRLGITPRAVQKALAEGRLHGTRVGGVWVVDPEDARHYQEARRAC